MDTSPFLRPRRPVPDLEGTQADIAFFSLSVYHGRYGYGRLIRVTVTVTVTETVTEMGAAIVAVVVVDISAAIGIGVIIAGDAPAVVGAIDDAGPVSGLTRVQRRLQCVGVAPEIGAGRGRSRALRRRGRRRTRDGGGFVVGFCRGCN